MKGLIWVHSTHILRLKWDLSVGSWNMGDELYQGKIWAQTTLGMLYYNNWRRWCTGICHALSPQEDLWPIKGESKLECPIFGEFWSPFKYFSGLNVVGGWTWRMPKPWPHISKIQTQSNMYVLTRNALSTTYTIILTSSLYRINVELKNKKGSTWAHALHHMT